MYPNFNAEYARGNFTLEKLSNEMEKRGCKRTPGTLSRKLNGKYPITVDEALVMKTIVAPNIPLEILFDKEAV